MKRTKKTDYKSPTTTVILVRCMSMFASSGNVEQVEQVDPDDWTAGNTDWWNS